MKRGERKTEGHRFDVLALTPFLFLHHDATAFSPRNYVNPVSESFRPGIESFLTRLGKSVQLKFKATGKHHPRTRQPTPYIFHPAEFLLLHSTFFLFLFANYECSIQLRIERLFVGRKMPQCVRKRVVVPLCAFPLHSPVP